MISKMFENWFFDFTEVIKMFYPPVIDENTIFFYSVSFFWTVLFIFALIYDFMRELFKKDRNFDFIYGNMGMIAFFYLLGIIGPYVLEYFPPF